MFIHNIYVLSADHVRSHVLSPPLESMLSAFSLSPPPRHLHVSSPHSANSPLRLNMFKIIVGTLLLLQVCGVSMCPATNHCSTIERWNLLFDCWTLGPLSAQDQAGEDWLEQDPAQVLLRSAANRLIGEIVQSRRRPLLGPSPGWRAAVRHYANQSARPFWLLRRGPHFTLRDRGVNARLA